MATIETLKLALAGATTILLSLLAMLTVQVIKPQALGSVTVGNEYIATSTAASNAYGGFTGDALVLQGTGTFGSLVVTGANTGVINIYDATTTVVGAGGRAASKATSTILIASIPASMAAGAYPFDVAFKDGLLFDLISGSMPTTTVTYRR